MKKFKICGIILGVVGAVATTSNAATNLIDQAHGIGAGSFELGAWVRNGFPGNHMHLDPGSVVITGWTVGGPAGIDWLAMPDNAPSTGQYSIDLSGTPGIGSISTTIPTVAGTEYLISFDSYGGVETLPLALTVGDLILTLNSPGNPVPSVEGFTNFQYTFTALGSSTVITFAATPTSYGFGPVIDNVIVAIPEPSSVAFVGLFALGLLVKRKR
jgi:hypothetical protein